MTRRRCSHCNTSNGHNARTCSSRCGGGGGGGLKLFGVRLMDVSSIKKSASMGNLSHYCAAVDSMEGYHSDFLNYSLMADRGRLRKKGIPWTEEEHRQFLVGLHKLGRGNWRGISRNYVPSRTPTQVASHAQKYFIRQSNSTEQKKRPSLFDLAPNTGFEYQETNSSMPEQSKASDLPSSEGVDIKNSLHSLDLSLKLAFTPFPFQIRREATKMSQLNLGESSEAKIAPI